MLNPCIPDTESSSASKSEVPDLPDNLAKGLADACKATAKGADRQKILDDIYLYLKQKGIIDNVDKLTYGGTNKSTYGLTTPIPNQPSNFDNKAQVDVFSAAFDSGPAVVYSTIRHDLVHAEQFKWRVDVPKQSKTPQLGVLPVNMKTTKPKKQNPGQKKPKRSGP